MQELASTEALYLESAANAGSAICAGSLQTRAAKGRPDHYVYDPHDLSSVARDLDTSVPYLTDQRAAWQDNGKELVYHSAPFVSDTELSGFFSMRAWIAINRPDTDFQVSVYKITASGASVYLTGMRFEHATARPRAPST